MRLRFHLDLTISAAVCFALLGSGPQAVANSAPTTTTLAVTSGGKAVTTVASGAVVTLTATAVAGSTPVTPGLVNFCDATATYCEDIHILGSAQLVGNGTATFKFRPGIGSHSYKAVFVGTKTYAASTSATTGLTETGLYTSSTAIRSVSASSSYTLTATVTGKGSATPTGTVSLLDTGNGNAVLATAELESSQEVLSWDFPVPIATGNNVDGGIVEADFNGDGIPDLAVTDFDSGGVIVFLGKGNGYFESPKTTLATGQFPGTYLAVGDFNGDGKPDLALIGMGCCYPANTEPGYVAIFLGNGDGTFTPTAASPSTGFAPIGIAVGDFNEDGIPDLAVANACGADNVCGGSNGTVTILLGNGDGTFTAAASPVVGEGPFGIAVADFNGDGNLDLAVANYTSGTVTILLGKGDGTFTATASSLTVGMQPEIPVAADFNGDGVPDLAVAFYGEAGGLDVFIGNGDGTFSTTGPIPGVDGTTGVVVGDFNGDGIADLAAPEGLNHDINAAYLLLGIGTGSFTLTDITNPGLGVKALAVGDFNGDGVTDLAGVGAVYPRLGSVQVALSEPGVSGTATASGIAVSVGATYHVEASFPGDGTLSSSVSPSIIVAAVAPSVLNAPSPAPSPDLGTSETFTWTAGSGPTKYDFHLGTSGPGSIDLYDSGPTTVLTSPAVAIPSNGYTVYARISSYFPIRNVWTHTDYTFTESGAPVSSVLNTPSPAPSRDLGTLETFTWTAGSGPTKYDFHVGTTGVDSINLYDSGPTTALTSPAVAIPSSGHTVYVRISSYFPISNIWTHTDYTFTESH